MEMKDLQGISPRDVPRLIRQDVEFAKTNAVGLFRIRPDLGVEFKSNETDPGKTELINVLAVVGPSQGFGREFDETLLMEIGIKRANPYSRARMVGNWQSQKNRAEYRAFIHRRKWFWPTPEQYQALAPVLFQKIQERADETAKQWRQREFHTHFTHRYWNRKKHLLTERNAGAVIPKGVRFRASAKDRLFLSDLYFAELRQNEHLRGYLTGLAKYLGFMGRERPNGFYSLDSLKTEIGEKKRLCAHHLHELINRMPEKMYGKMGPILKESLGLNGISQEHQLAASRLPKPQKRIGNIQIRTIISLADGRDYVSFEVYPTMFFTPTDNSEQIEYCDEETETPF